MHQLHQLQQTTIAAIATPQGTGGLGIVRLSGPEAVTIVEQMFTAYSGKPLSALEGYQGTLGRILEGEQVIDEVIVFRYRSPKSYTGEDVIEISGHGGRWVTNKILRLCYDHGAQPAEAGEFTKRGFLNGKLDLAQAEAVMDIISAQGEASLKAANQLHDGALSREVRSISEAILEQAGHMAVWADFPDEDLEALEEDVLTQSLQQSKERLERLLTTYDYGQILKEGVATAIVGKPNVGKSTLMNLFIGYDRSIVSDIPGTTRDVVSESVRLGDIVLRLHDTAGIRSSQDPIEKIGIQLAKEEMEQAQLILALFDNSQALDAEDIKLLEGLQDKTVLILVNKSDLESKLNLQKLESYGHPVLSISALAPDTVQELEPTILRLMDIEREDDQIIIANERQRQHLLAADAALQEALDALALGVTYDAITVCLEESLDQLLSLTGQRASEEIVTQVFSNFCVGK